MKAIIYTRYGTPDDLKLVEVAQPVPQDHEVLVKVHAVSLNDWDIGILKGDVINRLLTGLVTPKIRILGSDIAGRIEAVGKNVTKFQPGDDVYGDLSGRWGGFAEFVCAPEGTLCRKPARMTYEQAAAIPQAAMLAIQGLRDKGNIQDGKEVLINGAGGGVGTFAIQIARLYGVKTTGVDSSDKLEIMRSLGFDHLIDYTQEDFTRNQNRYDLILDVKTNRPMSHYARALRPHGIYVTVGGSMTRLLQALIIGPWLSKLSNKHIRIVALKPNKDLAYMNELFESGKINPVVDGHYTLADVPQAFRNFESSSHKGKIVITVNDR